jgi:hypothetical protein
VSNRRKIRPARPKQVVKVVVDPDELEQARAGFRTIRQCNACGGHAHTDRKGSLHVTHIGDCPAEDNPSLIVGTGGGE